MCLIMIKAVFLDTTSLGLAAQRLGKKEADDCRQWLADMAATGSLIYATEIADYEVRRELVRTNATPGIARLDALYSWLIYLPITTAAMRKAADLWAEARNQGYATADPKALDGDVIVAAQALTAGYADAEIVVATDNVVHLSRYVNAEEWRKITP
jgi:hypothetical protein